MIGQRVRCLDDGQVGTVDTIAEAAVDGVLTYRVERPDAQAVHRIAWVAQHRLEATGAV